jgi:hypothetical protein
MNRPFKFSDSALHVRIASAAAVIAVLIALISIALL